MYGPVYVLGVRLVAIGSPSCEGSHRCTAIQAPSITYYDYPLWLAAHVWKASYVVALVTVRYGSTLL